MLGLYLHLPFCRVHCTYCPFAISTDISMQDRYVDALVREIEAKGHGEAVDTVYFGGGTPSWTSLPNLRRIAEALRRSFAIEPGAEFTLEANPEDVTRDAVIAWRELGVNRVSVGVQSFDDRELGPIGRLHGSAGAWDAVAIAVASGVRTTLDLIAGLPGQTMDSFAATLQRAIDSGVGHLSLYMLDLEERTPLEAQVRRGRVQIPEDSVVADQYLMAVARLGEAGLQQYEISNFARPGEESRHNLRYWRREPYLGFGISAHSFDGSSRYANTRDIRRYVELAPDSEDFREELTPDDERRERIFLGLRQASGIIRSELIELCGQEGVSWSDRGLEEGWLRRVGERIGFTPSGFVLSNEYISQLF